MDRNKKTGHEEASVAVDLREIKIRISRIEDDMKTHLGVNGSVSKNFSDMDMEIESIKKKLFGNGDIGMFEQVREMRDQQVKNAVVLERIDKRRDSWQRLWVDKIFYIIGLAAAVLIAVLK